MANNLNVSPGAGATVAAESDGTALHQQILLEFGTAGTQTRVDNGHPLPIYCPTSIVVTQSGGSNLHCVVDAGSAIIGKVGIDQTTPGTTNAVQAISGTTGGATPFRYLAAAGANQDTTNVKASAGTVYTISCFNTNASIRYLKLYNNAGSPTSASTPVQTYLLPGNASGAGFTLSFPTGMAFSSGIAFRMTTGQADNDTGTVTAADLVLSLTYL